MRYDEIVSDENEPEPMDLQTFIASPIRNLWIVDTGLNYYVYKHLLYKGLIVLSNCNANGDEPFAMWKFLKKYADKIPFKMEQVLNPSLAAYMRRLGWTEELIGGVPQFYSPLAMQKFDIKLRPSTGDFEWLKPSSPA